MKCKPFHNSRSKISYKSLSSSILACRPSSSVTRCRSSAQRRQLQKKKKRKKLKKSSRKRNNKKKKKNSPIIIQADLKLNRRLGRHSTKCHSETVINTAAYWWIVVMCAPFVARIHVPVTVMRSQSGSNFCRHPPPSLCLFPFSSHRWNRWCVHACTSYRFGRSRGHLLTGVWSGLPKPSRFSSLSPSSSLWITASPIYKHRYETNAKMNWTSWASGQARRAKKRATQWRRWAARRSRLWPLLNGLVHGGIRLLRGRIIIIIIKCWLCPPNFFFLPFFVT